MKVERNELTLSAGITSVPEDLDVAELRRLYVEQELPVREVANRLGCSASVAIVKGDPAFITNSY